MDCEASARTGEWSCSKAYVKQTEFVIWPPMQQTFPVALQLYTVVVAQVVYAKHLPAALQKCLNCMKSNESSRPRNQYLHGAYYST